MCYGNLILTGVSIQEAIVVMARQTLKHLINEWQREVILPSGGVELPVVNANSVAGHGPLWHQLILSILHNSDSGLLWYHLYWRHPFGV